MFSRYSLSVAWGGTSGMIAGNLLLLQRSQQLPNDPQSFYEVRTGDRWVHEHPRGATGYPLRIYVY